MKDHNTVAAGKEKKDPQLLPYWASELLEMWKDVERSHKARRPSSQEVS